MTFLVSLIFILIFYVVPLHRVVEKQVLVFPALGHEGSWLLTAGAIYVFLAVGALGLKQFEDVLVPAFPRWRKELTRRTGIAHIDNFGFRMSFLATILFLVTDASLIPLGVASTIGFASLKYQKQQLRVVKQTTVVKGKRDKKAKSNPLFDEPVSRKYVWQTKEALDRPFESAIELTIDRRRYEKYAENNPYSRGRPATRNYQELVTEGITEEIRNLAGDLRAISSERRLSSYQEIAGVLAFVQSIEYKSDQETKGREYIRWPIETLYDAVGDSNCKSVLLAAILFELGYGVVIVEAQGKTAVGVSGAEGLPGRFLAHKGRRYYYCEASTSDWRVGHLPPDLGEGQFRVYPIIAPDDSEEEEEAG
ncbi:MAG TPA: hypothetical protein ENI11_05535 [Actinobacteria bacterium]|nr:hypothetical protein [Actinomycetota bacterium]